MDPTATKARVLHWADVGTTLLPGLGANASLPGPVQMGYQMSEKNLMWNDDLKARLVKASAACSRARTAWAPHFPSPDSSAARACHRALPLPALCGSISGCRAGPLF